MMTMTATGGGGTTEDITDEPHYFQIFVTRAATDSSLDGIVDFYIDGALMETNTDIDNYDLFGTIDSIYATGTALEVAMSGTTYYLDEVLLEDAIPALAFSGYDLVLGDGLP